MTDERYRSLINEWADELAIALGRPANSIRESGLSVEDFPNQVLEIEFEDGSTARLRWAFFVESPRKKAVAVFSEHCGYFVLPIAGLKIETVRG